MPASGTQYELTYGDYRAVVVSVGASLRTLTHRGRHLVLGYGPDEVRPRFRGAVLAPWPNRVPDGRWTRHGVAHQLSLTEPDRAAALHGLVTWSDWTADLVRDDTVSLTTRIAAQAGYPFTLDLVMTWRLGPDGLTAQLRATNVGSEPAPYGCSIHPYLVPGVTGSGDAEELVDDWSLELPAALRLETDDRLQVTGPPTPPPAEADFRSARRIGEVRIDHAYTGFDFHDGRCSVVLRDAQGVGARITFGPDTPWVQVHTSDLDGDASVHRRGVAVEPMTCPPEALTSGVDLIELEPGASASTEWLVSAV